MGLIGSRDTHTHAPPNPLSFIMKEVEGKEERERNMVKEKTRDEEGEMRACRGRDRDGGQDKRINTGIEKKGGAGL